MLAGSNIREAGSANVAVMSKHTWRFDGAKNVPYSFDLIKSLTDSESNMKERNRLSVGINLFYWIQLM